MVYQSITSYSICRSCHWVITGSSGIINDINRKKFSVSKEFAYDKIIG